MNTFNYEDYQNINDNTDRKAKRDALNKQLGEVGKAFNYFVLSSILFFYKDGSHSINIINDLLQMAQKSRGMNATRLAAYLRKVIPHVLDEGDNRKGIAPQFNKKNGDYLSVEDVEVFVYRNSEWFKFGNNLTTKQIFNVSDYISLVAAKLEKNNVVYIDFEQELRVVMAKRALDAIGK